MVSNNKWMLYIWLAGCVYPSYLRTLQQVPEIVRAHRKQSGWASSADFVCAFFFSSHLLFTFVSFVFRKYLVVYVRWLCLVRMYSPHIKPFVIMMCGSVSFHPISPYAIQSKKILFIALSFMDSNVISCRLLFRFFFFHNFSRVKWTNHERKGRKRKKFRNFIWNVCDAMIIINNCQWFWKRTRIHTDSKFLSKAFSWLWLCVVLQQHHWNISLTLCPYGWHIMVMLGSNKCVA